MVQKHRFVTLEQEPVLYFPNDVFLPLRLLVLMRYALIDILLLALVGLPRMHHTYFLLSVVSELYLLDYLLVLKINLVHLGAHVQLVLAALLC